MTAALLAVLLAQAGVTPEQRAQALLDEGDFDGALATLDAALPAAATAKERSQLNVLRAECFAAKRQFAEVDAAFVAVLRDDPELRLDPSHVTPTVVGMLEVVRERLRGTLTVSCDSAGIVSVDGAVFGECPSAGALRIGRHRVEGRSLDGDRRGSKEVLVFPETEAAVSLELAAAPRNIKFALQAAATFDVLALALGQTAVTAELGAGVGLRNVLVSLHVMLRAAPGLSVRASGRLPELAWRFGVAATADFTVFLSSPLALSGGLRAGPLFQLWRFFELYVDVGWQHAGVDTRFLRSDYLLLVGGLRAVL